MMSSEASDKVRRESEERAALKVLGRRLSDAAKSVYESALKVKELVDSQDFVPAHDKELILSEVTHMEKLDQRMIALAEGWHDPDDYPASDM